MAFPLDTYYTKYLLFRKINVSFDQLNIIKLVVVMCEDQIGIEGLKLEEHG